jgi:hypothetical protein
LLLSHKLFVVVDLWWLRAASLIALVLGVAAVVAAGLAVSVADLVAAPHAAPARADASTGAGGLFVPLQGRILDTRNGTGGYSTPMPAGVWRPVTVDGKVGMPSSDISVVAVNFTIEGVSAHPVCNRPQTTEPVYPGVERAGTVDLTATARTPCDRRRSTACRESAGT